MRSRRYRDPGKLGLNNPKLHVVRGSLQDAAAIEQAVVGADAVMSALGPEEQRAGFRDQPGHGRDSGRVEKCGVRRLVMTAGMGVADPQDRPGLMNRVISAMLALAAKNVAEDMRQAVAKVRASGIDWTVIRAAAGGQARRPAAEGRLRRPGRRHRAGSRDFAKALLDAATTGKYVREMPAVSN